MFPFCNFTVSAIYLENDNYDLLSPNYPNQYPNNRTYDWEFQASSRFIVINILDFETEFWYDFVTIEGPGLELGELGKGNALHLHGTTHITRITSELPEVRVIFNSDVSTPKKGFHMRIEALEISKYYINYAPVSSNIWSLK